MAERSGAEGTPVVPEGSTQRGAVAGISPSDRQWVELAQSLSPTSSLQALAEHAKWLVATVGTIGTLLTGFGLVAAPRIAASDLATILSVLSLAAAGFSLLVATWSLRLRRAALNVNDLSAVEEWYGEEMGRATAQRIAGGALTVAILAAGLTAGVVLLSSARDDGTAVQLVTHRGSAGEVIVAGSVTCSSCDPGSTLEVALVQVDGSSRDELASATVEATQDGAVSLSLPEVEVDAGATVELIVNGCVEATQDF